VRPRSARARDGPPGPPLSHARAKVRIFGDSKVAAPSRKSLHGLLMRPSFHSSRLNRQNGHPLSPLLASSERPRLTHPPRKESGFVGVFWNSTPGPLCRSPEQPCRANAQRIPLSHPGSRRSVRPARPPSTSCRLFRSGLRDDCNHRLSTLF